MPAVPGAPEVRLLTGDARTVLAGLPDASVACVITSPPYWRQRDYRVAGQLGLQETIEEYVDDLAAVFDQVRRVLTPTGTCWINVGDSYLSGPSGRRTNPGTLNGRPNTATSPAGFGVKRGLAGKLTRGSTQAWLFPGLVPGRPLTIKAFNDNLLRHGIDTRAGRNAALIALAAELPVPVLADLLGVHIQTAQKWAAHVQRDWATYLTIRTPAPTQGED